MSAWIDFMLYGKETAHGKSLEEILQYDYDRMENDHSYIQWLFPNAVPSKFNPDAPLLTESDVHCYKTLDLLQERVFRSFLHFLDFLGIRLTTEFERGNDFDNQSVIWLCESDHNHLRITRVLHFLRYVGEDHLAVGLYDFLMKEMHNNGYSDIAAVKYWEEAVYG